MEDENIKKGLSVELKPYYELIENVWRPCANVIIRYDDKIIDINDTYYSYYFDDKPVLAFYDVTNLSTGIHNFKCVIVYKDETKIANADKYFSKYQQDDTTIPETLPNSPQQPEVPNKPIAQTKFKFSDLPNYIKYPIVATGVLPYYTADIERLYYTQYIRIDFKQEDIDKGYIHIRAFANIDYRDISYIRIYNKSGRFKQWHDYNIDSDGVNNIDLSHIDIHSDDKLLVIRLKYKKYMYKTRGNGIECDMQYLTNNRPIIKYPSVDVIRWDKKYNIFCVYPSLPVSIEIQPRIRIAGDRAAHFGMPISHIHKWQRKKDYINNIPQIDMNSGSYSLMFKHKSVFKIRYISNKRNSSEWSYFYVIVEGDDYKFIRIS